MLGIHQSRYRTLPADSPSKMADRLLRALPPPLHKTETTNTNKHTKGASCGDAAKPKSRKEKPSRLASQLLQGQWHNCWDPKVPPLRRLEESSVRFHLTKNVTGGSPAAT